ncbi:MAG: hypothetical protein BMS9Abin23_0932 [Thermodesulfobacteriota bacterium]|nr:MAG: hypothetical protein BMS9Abin23_0932 [Thermodesulfobacteriota bacterium]
MVFLKRISRVKAKGLRRVCALVSAAVILAGGVFFSNYAYGAEPVVIELTQTPCTIIEAEANPREFVSKSKSDCIRINKETAGERTFKVLRLKPGRTVFRVTNKNVPYDLGFWVRGKGVKRLTLPTVSGGGLKTGATADYTIDLEPGEYYYSCPLNPTPNYPLIVE